MLTRITVSLHTEKDADVLAWIKAQKESASRVVRDALRAQFERHAEYTLADVMRRLDDIERNGVMVTRVDSSDANEPIEAADALEGLGL